MQSSQDSNKPIFKRRRNKIVTEDSEEDLPVNQPSNVNEDQDQPEPTPAPGRRRRMIKRTLDDLEDEFAGQSSDSQAKHRGESDDDYSIEDKVKKMKAKILKPKKERAITVGSDSGESDFDQAKGGKKKRAAKTSNPDKQARKKKAPKPQAVVETGFVKTSNKLIGEIHNDELYNSDEGFAEDNHQTFKGESLDFGGATKQPAQETGKFFKKMQTKKEQVKIGVEQEVINLGFV